MNISKERKKELIKAYKERKEIGGVYKVTNTVNGRFLLCAEPNIEGSKNFFQFSCMTNTCFHPAISSDWHEYGKDAFTFEILTELEKKEIQSPKEFKEDLEALKEMISEGLDKTLEY